MVRSALVAAALAIALADCGGGGGVVPASTQAAAPVSSASSFVMPKAVGTVPTFTYEPVIVPANGQLLDQGVAFTLAAAVPVYNIGSTNTVQFEFAANSQGIPVATQVGTASTGVDVQLSGGTVTHTVIINGKSSVSCGLDEFNWNTGGFPNSPTDTTGIAYIDYFVCTGNPFS